MRRIKLYQVEITLFHTNPGSYVRRVQSVHTLSYEAFPDTAAPVSNGVSLGLQQRNELFKPEHECQVTNVVIYEMFTMPNATPSREKEIFRWSTSSGLPIESFAAKLSLAKMA